MKTMHRRIIDKYSAELPNLGESFRLAESLKPCERVAWAKEQRAQIFRDGWFVNTPVGVNGDGETVQSHVEHLKVLIEKYLPQEHIDLASVFAECHDDQEVLARSGYQWC
jgi:hypothetical protein